MSKRDFRWVVVGSLFAIAGGAFWALRHGSQSGAGAAGQAAGDGFAGFSTRPSSPVIPETPEQAAHQVDDAMVRWRAAILTKDAATVIALDQDFHQRPVRYRDALEKSARTDENERVRAFSTRVLGKLKDAQEAALFKNLMSDSSPYVRQNAAWGLGELGGAGAVAVAELRHARTKDSAEAVRLAARDALGKVE
jgi:hypothetical protein